MTYEESEDLHDVVEPWRWVCCGWVTLHSERTKHSLGDDSTDLARSGRKTVRGRSISCWEAFSWDDEGGGVGSEVEEELAQDVEGEKCVMVQLVIGEADDAEKDRKDDEAHKLDWLATDGVDRCDCNPITWNGTCTNDDQVTNGGISEDVVDARTASVSNGLENDGVIEAETVESNVEEEP